MGFNISNFNLLIALVCIGFCHDFAFGLTIYQQHKRAPVLFCDTSIKNIKSRSLKIGRVFSVSVFKNSALKDSASDSDTSNSFSEGRFAILN
jgi:hypothetical protein